MVSKKRGKSQSPDAASGAARIFWAVAALAAVGAAVWVVMHPPGRAHPRSTGDSGTAPTPDHPATPTPDNPTPPPPHHPTAGATLNAHEREAISAVLRDIDGHRPVWILATDADPKAYARAEELAGIFTDAGWDVKELGHTPVRVRAGVFLFAADESPPGYIHSASQALEAGGLAPTFAGGYRAYYEQSVRERPGFQGFELAADQPYVIVVGRVE